ncbi:MAG TPA: response regulator [Candidatus Acidoferrum sp.]|jgi:CheY-like chemotaxis protein|nr:response regulator [Candidatus Acidoferrum sp.]
MKKILIADDDASVRKMVARVLESAGYSTVLASGGREAVAKSRSTQPDLILLDVKMPEQGGWEAFEHISRVAALIPVIVMTAWPNQYEQVVQRGIDALMEKPLDLPLLLRTIEGLLREPEQQRSRRLTNRNFTTAYLASVSGIVPGIS